MKITLIKDLYDLPGRLRLQSPQVAIHLSDSDWRINQAGAAP
jgi:hypothetical protein